MKFTYCLLVVLVSLVTRHVNATTTPEPETTTPEPETTTPEPESVAEPEQEQAKAEPEVEPEVVYGILGALLACFVILSLMFFVMWRQAKKELQQSDIKPEKTAYA